MKGPKIKAMALLCVATALITLWLAGCDSSVDYSGSDPGNRQSDGGASTPRTSSNARQKIDWSEIAIGSWSALIDDVDIIFNCGAMLTGKTVGLSLNITDISDDTISANGDIHIYNLSAGYSPSDQMFDNVYTLYERDSVIYFEIPMAFSHDPNNSNRIKISFSRNDGGAELNARLVTLERN